MRPVRDLKMYYEIHGEGKTPLVLIHGGGSTMKPVLPIYFHCLQSTEK